MAEASFELFACDAEGQRERPYEGALGAGERVRLKTSIKVSSGWLEQVPDFDVGAVALVGPKRSHEEVRLVAERFRGLDELRVTQAKGLTDETGALLAKDQPNLRRLYIFMSSIGDDGAAAIATLDGLQYLTLTNARLTDGGLSALGQLRALKHLRIDGNFQVQGEGLESFIDHPALEELWMPGTRVGDGPIGYLSGCTKLMKVSLTSTAVTAACVRALPQNPMAAVDLPQSLDAADVDEVRRDCPNLVIDGYRAAEMIGLTTGANDSVDVPPVLRRDVLTLAIFSGPGCSPCTVLKRELNLVRPNLREQYRLVEIDVDQEPDAATSMNVRTLPTTVVLVEGREAFRFHGVAREQDLTRLLERWAR